MLISHTAATPLPPADLPQKLPVVRFSNGVTISVERTLFEAPGGATREQARPERASVILGRAHFFYTSPPH